MKEFTADEKALALNFAFTALVKSLHDDGILEMDHLFRNLAGATQQLTKLGEAGAANALGSMAEKLTAI